ncbi:polymorphic toxin type 47 domain-containing protein [Deinococcus frigens]|uniref:polymorphic toxin type 47 domain-containing protein n=1 Tax=Deinococcus frigens TaxID=249403 RepID=UPI0012EB7FA7|nr:polymorphic toxin type 47 domain-containing protein [Deinococcus frigens]
MGAGHLKIGDKIKLADGTVGVIANVVTVQQTREMFNLTVSEAHTYYVGQEGWLVHNQGGPTTPGANSRSAGNGWTYNSKVDLDLRGSGLAQSDAVNEAFRRIGVPRDQFEITRWGKTAEGKSFPVEWRVTTGQHAGAEVNIDWPHSKNGPEVPHVGYQTAGKRGSGGAVRGHILLDLVTCNR